jgi:hypothetical protein
MGEGKKAKRIVLSRDGQLAGSPPRSLQDETPPGRRNIFLLSPANAFGQRAKTLLHPLATFDLANRLRTTGISLGEAFSFMSSLYFRGKLTYATTFFNPVKDIPGSLIITPSCGLLRPETTVNLTELTEIVGDRIAADNPQYRDPLERDLRRLSEAIGQQFQVVFLGSIATRKYIPLLLQILGERLVVPRAFIGMGNMQRGALLLKCSRERCELDYISVRNALAQRR